jgi:hypothetical protein
MCQSPFVLSKGETLIVPVFADNLIGTLADGFLSPITYVNLYQSLQDATIVTSDTSQVTFGMLVLSGEELASNGIFFQQGMLKTDLQTFLTAFDTRFRGLL